MEKRLGSSPDGLSQAEAQERLARYGPNEIEEKKENPLLKLLAYFWGPIPWMIEAAVILSGVLRHWPDFFIILVLLVANAAVGFWEEHQAGKAIDALKAQLAVKCRVRRDGTWVTPPSRELVPGDVIRMRMGDIVPADARLLAGDPVEVDQSALTGESLPVTAGPGGAVFSGSIIRQGEIGALVYATGAGTYFGKTAELVQDAQTVSHFQRAVLKIGTYLIILAVAMVAVITVVSIVRGNPVLDTLQFALVLTVAAIPVAIPTVLSVTMAVGARLLAKKQAIVSLAGGDRGTGRRGRAQTLMYLMLSVAGSMTIYLTRTRGPFWSIRPARILVLAVTGTEVIATLLAVYGIFMTRKQVAIPVGSVASTGDGIQLTITKQEVRDLPAVDIDHPDATPAGGQDTDDRSGH